MAKEMNPVCWFEIPVSDMKRAKKFYEKVFGCKLKPEKMGPCDMAMFPMQQEACGAGGSLIKVEGCSKPSHDGTLVYFAVEAIEPALKKIEKAGGKTLMPRTPIGQYGFIAHFEDSEGNRVALHSLK